MFPLLGNRMHQARRVIALKVLVLVRLLKAVRAGSTKLTGMPRTASQAGRGIVCMLSSDN
jgi:hypothetical protein